MTELEKRLSKLKTNELLAMIVSRLDDIFEKMKDYELTFEAYLEWKYVVLPKWEKEHKKNDKQDAN